MEKIWLSSYDKGVKSELDLSIKESMADVIINSAKKFSDKIAIKEAMKNHKTN